jgi:hypothetical protein
MQLDDSRFRYTREGLARADSGIDYGALDLKNLQLKAEDLRITSDTVGFFIRNLSFHEKCGFVVEKMNCYMSLSNRHMSFDNVYLVTPFSVLSGSVIHLGYTSYRDFSDIINNIEMRINLRSSLADFRDIGYFAPALMGYDEQIKVSGLIGGRISDMRGDRILLSYNDQTYLEGSFNMIGLPDFRQTFMHFNVQNLQTSTSDLRDFNLPGNKKLRLPDKFDRLGTITYEGKFTGYPDDFVAYGRFNTALGPVSSDLWIKPGAKNELLFKGNIKTLGFRAGELTESDLQIGSVSLSLAGEGTIKDKGLIAVMSGNVDSLEVYGYNYKNIRLSGELTDKLFDGSFNISDPNIAMVFNGKVDFTSKLPEFAFTADVARIRPYYLNIYKKDPGYFASFLLKTNFTGDNIDDLNGNIQLVNSYFEHPGEQIQVYDFSLEALSTADSNRIVIRSDIADADIKGKYQFSTIASSFKNFGAYYLPSLFGDNLPEKNGEDRNDFQYDIHLKQISSVLGFFIPELHVANNTFISGAYHPQASAFDITASSPLFGFRDNTWKDLAIKSSADSSGIDINVGSSVVTSSSNLELENLSMVSSTGNDSVRLNIGWNSRTGPKYQGVLNLEAALSENRITDNPSLRLRLLPSRVVFNDTTWNISESFVSLDSSSVLIDSFSISNQLQSFLVYGGVSSDPAENLNFEFNNLDLATLDIFSDKLKMEFDGTLTGKANLRNVYNNPLLLADLSTKNVYVNGEELGSGEIRAIWNNKDAKIHLLASTSRGNAEVLRVEGDYYPGNKALDFDIRFDNLKLNTIYPLASDLISDIRGLGSGKLKLTGTAGEPDMNGEINLVKASFMVNYLKTRYTVSNKVNISHNNFVFRNFEIFDTNGNKAVGDGAITSRFFRSFNLDLRLQTSNFSFLNTTEKDNELFYGTIFAGGIIRFTGPPDNLVMDITAKSGRNSVFNIPLFGAEEIYEYNFIQFTGTQNPDTEYERTRYEVNLRGLTMNFNLEVTPDAEVQLIFDPKIGDIIKGRGRGNLKLNISTLGKFEIFGDIIIERGDYLFTLQNLINKKLEVIPGGRISWNGDPEDANIDLQAVYSVRTSVYALDPTRESLKKRIPVECVVHLSGKLMNPGIKPSITLPTADQETRNIVSNSISTDEDMMKQFLSLLIINNFLSDQLLTGSSSGSGGRGSAALTGGAVATSELISNQLSQWLSQISKDFDLGFNYRPGDEITNDEVEVAFSTQILNDRVTINTNLGVGGNQVTQTQNQNTNNIVGDFDIDFQLTENGKVHLKAFNRSNDNLLFQTSPYTQGVGAFYREEFNSFGELFGRYRDAILSLFQRDKRKKKDLTSPPESDSE